MTDVLQGILESMMQERPDSVFINSLYQQYCNRGGLSRKQLEGLLDKGRKIEGYPQNKLATLEAIIKKKPIRERAPASKTVAPIVLKDETTGQIIDEILQKYPGHKRVLFLKLKYDNNETITPQEISELEKFKKILFK